jgi:5-methylthioadenosine/S-adenosylhomocysteine deaminase
MVAAQNRLEVHRVADLIIRADMVWTDDADNHVIRDGAVAVTGSRIADVGPADRILSDYGNGAEIMNVEHGLVMPGLVNAHTHVSMTCLRGLADDLELMTWLNKHIFPAEAQLSGEMVYWGAMLGCAEMIMSGTTFFCDMYLFEDQVARAVDRSGLRALVGEVLYDFPSPNYGLPDEGLKFTEQLIEQYKGHERVSIAVEPHALYTCSPDLLKSCRELAERHNVPLITHLSENQNEVDTIKERYQTTPVRHLHNLGILNENLIADHCVVLDAEEIDLLAKNRVRVVHNPQSNMKLASGIAPVPEMLAAGVKVGLGADGPASNNNLDIFEEMDSAAKLHKVHLNDPTVMKSETVLAMATSTGADVLGQGDKTGRLAQGYLADLIVIDLDQPHLTPMYNPSSHLVYSANGADVMHTMVHGRWLMEDRKLTTIDLREVYNHMAAISEIMAKAVNNNG